MAVKKFSKRLNALSAAALALPGIAPRLNAAAVADKVSADFLYSRYEECCERIKVNVFEAATIFPFGEHAQLSVNWGSDIVSGSSPVLNVPKSRANVISGASANGARVALSNDENPGVSDAPVEVLSTASIRDTRHALDVNGQFFFGRSDLTVGVGISKERDYEAHSGNLELRHELKRKLTTLSIAAGYSSDEIEPTDRAIKKHKSSLNASTGITRILDKNSLLNVRFSYTYSTGFLSNPYKKIFIDGAGSALQGLVATKDVDVFFERRPDKRHQYALELRYIRHFSGWNAALHADYRFHVDSWDIQSHTIDLSWHQPLANGWMLTPSFRYYSQDQADFYRPFYDAPRARGHYSSDYRLSGFGSISGGLSLSKEFFDKLRISVGFEYYTHEADLKLGSQTQSDFADFSYTLITSGIFYRF